MAHSGRHELATIMGSSSCRVNLAVSLLFTKLDNGMLCKVLSSSSIFTLSLWSTRNNFKIFECEASSGKEERVATGERARDKPSRESTESR